MRYRVERVRADYGYGTGWVVLDDLGTVVAFGYGWAHAFARACKLARSVPVS